MSDDAEREHPDEGGPVLAVPRAGRARLGLALPRLQAVRRVLPVHARGDGEEGGDPHTVGIRHRRLRGAERRARQHTRRVQSEFASAALSCLVSSRRLVSSALLSFGGRLQCRFATLLSSISLPNEDFTCHSGPPFRKRESRLAYHLSQDYFLVLCNAASFFPCCFTLRRSRFESFTVTSVLFLRSIVFCYARVTQEAATGVM